MTKTTQNGALFETLPVAAVVVDRDRKVLIANEDARRMIGVAQAHPAASCRELLHCVIPLKRCPLRRAWRDGGQVERAEIPVRLGGHVGWVIERLSSWRDSSGRLLTTLVWGPATRFHRRLLRLKRQARSDGMTGLLNRRGFDEIAVRRLHRRRGDKRAALLMIDIDGLKEVNDLRGHAAGDLLILRMAEVLRVSLRRSDVAGRVGGDEFAVFCPDTSPREARHLVKRLRADVARANAASGGSPRLAFSAGLAWEKRPVDYDALRRVADENLYREKAQSRVSRRFGAKPGP